MASKEQKSENLKNFEFKDWDDFIERLASGELPVIDAITSNQKHISENQDYESHINQARASYVMMQDVRILKQLMEEIDETIKEKFGDKYDPNKVNRDLKFKDGVRLFEKLGKFQSEAYGDGPSLITGKTFGECLSQYQTLCGYVEELWTRACEYFTQEKYPMATFFSILAIEEIGKLGRIWDDLMAWDQDVDKKKVDVGVLSKSHQKKHFLGVIPGSIINARLDRLIGQKTVKSILEDVESGRIEKLRQSCLYIDFKDGRAQLPDEQVDQETARIFVTLSGELWMEILGHFPWDFYRMLERVKEAELKIGLPEELVNPY